MFRMIITGALALLVVACATATPYGPASQGGGYEQGQGIAGWMWQHHKPVLINGQQDTVSVRNLMKDNPYKSALGVPIWLSEEFVGTLTLFSDETGTYRPEDVS